MPRPKRLSDDAILETAAQLLFEGGSADFTLSDVATAVGMARASLIQRFENRDNILRLVVARQVEQSADYIASLPCERSRAGLSSFLATIIGSMGDGEHFGVHVQLAWLETTDPELRRHAAERYALVQAAIAARLPEAVGNPAVIAQHLHAIIAGATMQWVASREGKLSEFVMKRVELAMEMIPRLDL